MSAEALLQAHIDAGLQAQPYGRWFERGTPWGGGDGPDGIMHHHTAAPVPFPTHRLIGSKLKANIQTQPSGQIWLLAYNACNYSSGPGNFGVLRDVRLGIVPTANAVDRGLTDNINGNPHFWNYENDHYGQGQLLPQVQFDAIVESTKIVAAHFGLDAPTQTISHAEWTKRKTDPYWNGNRRAIEDIRLALESNMSMSQEAQNWYQEAYNRLQTLNPPTSESLLKASAEHIRNHPSGGGGLSEAQVKALINDSQIVAPVD